MKKLAAIILCIAGCMATASAQTNKVSSVVLSAQNGEAVSGASVTVTGSNISTTTDMNGRFSIEAPAQYKTLTISHNNFQPSTMNILPDPIVMHPAKRFLEGWGIELGYASSTVGYDSDDFDDFDDTDVSRRGGFTIGITYDYPIVAVNNLSVMGGLFYLPKGVSSTEYESYYDEYYTEEYYANYLELQATAKYQYNLPVLNNELNAFALAGPYLAYGIGGDYTDDYDGYKESIFDECLDRWDAGLVLGLGLNYRNYSLTFRYDMGLVDVTSYDGKVYNRTCMFTLGYSF